MAAGMLDKYFTRRDAQVLVASAGLESVSLPVDPQAVRAARTFDVDIHTHRPRQVNSEILASEGSDLIVTMTRQHLRDLVFENSSLWPRSFTIREIVRLAMHIPANKAGSDLAGWLATLGQGRDRREALVDDPAFDVIDPYGQSMRKVQRVAADLDELAMKLSVSAPWPRPIKNQH